MRLPACFSWRERHEDGRTEKEGGVTSGDQSSKMKVAGAAKSGPEGRSASPGGRPGKQRVVFIDHFRGLVGVMMALGHSSYFFNSVWRVLDPVNPLFGSLGQYILRSMGYLCAPGFLMMNGAASWYSYTRYRDHGDSAWKARWHLIQRGLFLVLVQVTWVNSSWGGFAEFKPARLGIISCIGLSMVFMAFLVQTRWQIRLAIGLAIFAIHPLLLTIPYTAGAGLGAFLMQVFVDSGDWNKYPMLPWFALAVMGSVMGAGWFREWRTARKRIVYSMVIGLLAMGLAILVRMGRGYGNIWEFYQFGHYSFFLDQKYPPSLYHNLWFFGAVSFVVGLVHLVGQIRMPLVSWLGIVGRVPLFFYCIHLAVLGVFSKRMGLYYREGEVVASIIGWIALLAVMLPLAAWFGKIKAKSRNWFIRMV